MRRSAIPAFYSLSLLLPQFPPSASVRLGLWIHDDLRRTSLADGEPDDISFGQKIGRLAHDRRYERAGLGLGEDTIDSDFRISYV